MGRLMRIGIAKVENEPMLVKDIEAGVAASILPYPWDGILPLPTGFIKKTILLCTMPER